ncbi:acetate--CoA ligase family protein [Chloroflexota bacterium]
MDNKKPFLEEIFSPCGVAVVGVSLGEGYSFARECVIALKKACFPAIYPVNPKYKEVLGLPCYPSLQSIPNTVDHVVVCIPATSALKLLDDCTTKGVKSVHFFTAGFRESGDPEQVEAEQEMLKKAQEGGFRIIGPNCVGILVPKSRLTTTPTMPLEPGSIAFISQSGGHTEDIGTFGKPLGLRFSKMVSYGNALDVDESELLEYFSQDPETDIIAAYIEGVKDGRRFFNALKGATARKPVIMFKGGRTEAGLRAALSHTASLTSSVAVFDAMCRQLNVIQVGNFEELIDMLVMLSFASPLPKGSGVAIVGAGGGPAVLASDEMEMAGLQLPTLSPEVQEELKQFLPVRGGGFSNPVDATNLVSPDAIYSTLNALGKADNVHTLIYHLGFHPLSRWGEGRLSEPAYLNAAVEALKQARTNTDKTIVLAMRPAAELNGMEEFLTVQEAFIKAGFPVFHSLHQAARAIYKVVAWNKSRRDDKRA